MAEAVPDRIVVVAAFFVSLNNVPHVVSSWNILRVGLRCVVAGV